MWDLCPLKNDQLLLQICRTLYFSKTYLVPIRIDISFHSLYPSSRTQRKNCNDSSWDHLPSLLPWLISWICALKHLGIIDLNPYAISVARFCPSLFVRNNNFVLSSAVASTFFLRLMGLGGMVVNVETVFFVYLCWDLPAARCTSSKIEK